MPVCAGGGIWRPSALVHPTSDLCLLTSGPLDQLRLNPANSGLKKNSFFKNYPGNLTKNWIGFRSDGRASSQIASSRACACQKKFFPLFDRCLIESNSGAAQAAIYLHRYLIAFRAQTSIVRSIHAEK